MGTARVEKILIATHHADRDELLRRLQEEGILHISEHASKNRAVEHDAIPERQPGYIKQTLANLNQAITFLSGYAEKRKSGMFAAKSMLPADEFRRRVEELELEKKLAFSAELAQRVARLDAEERKLRTNLELLEPWKQLKHTPADYAGLQQTDARFLFISSVEEGKNLRKALKDMTANLESVKKDSESEYAIILFPAASIEDIEDVLKVTGVKMLALGGFDQLPAEEIDNRAKRLEAIEAEREEITTHARELAGELSGLETALDLFENEELIFEQHDKIYDTDKAGFIEGWVRNSDRKRLNEIVAEFEATEVRTLRPRKGEQVPVALRNPSFIRPFEMILNMFGTPDGREADPTPFMAPFFAIFFAMCLTDAGYGLLIACVAAYLIWGRKVRNDLVWILFYGGILTIITGAATGSWFGNMPEMLQIPWLSSLRDALTWFDPLKDPMPFFYISLGIGYFQMMFGKGLEVVDGIRTRDYGSALFETLPWFLIFLGVPLLIAVSMNVLPSFLTVPLIFLVIASLAVTLVLSHRPGPTSVTSAILMCVAMTAALLAAAKGFGLLAMRGIILKAALIGTVATLWLYTLFKGLSEKTLKPVGIVIGVLGMASIVLYIAGVLKGNLYLALVFVLILAFALSVLKGWGGRIIWGAYSVYSNTTGVLGVILSYVRLMALGMVTAGIAMAFNQIAWMMQGIPVVSIVLMLLVLVIGHVYNLLMSALSGFVHTLRLQYVEFFPQFFTGGGLRFEPFEMKTRYVKVTRRK